MKTYFLLLVLVLHGVYIMAQDTQIIHAGDDLSDYYTFRFPSFTEATILFKNRTVSKAKMNFNTFLCKMQFIDSNGDTLVVSKPEEIDSIELNDHSFFYNKGYYEVIAAADSMKLALLQRIHLDVVVTGALGSTSHTAPGNNYDTYITPNGPKKLELKNDLSVKKELVYSLVSQNGQMVVASKSGFLNMFANDKKGIESFLKSNKINFKNQADLEKLFAFCTRSKSLM